MASTGGVSSCSPGLTPNLIGAVMQRAPTILLATSSSFKSSTTRSLPLVLPLYCPALELLGLVRHSSWWPPEWQASDTMGLPCISWLVRSAFNRSQPAANARTPTDACQVTGGCCGAQLALRLNGHTKQSISATPLSRTHTNWPCNQVFF